MTTHIRRLQLAAMAAMLVVASSACSDYLKVTNPGAVDVAKLADSTDATLLVNGAIAEFQTMYGVVTLYDGIFSDEATSAHVNVSYNLLDQRNLTNNLDLVSATYSPIQRARFASDTTANRLIGYLGANAGADTRVARTLALAAYSEVILGETFCSAPIQGSKPLDPAALFQLSILKFDSAVAVAKAASAGNNNKLAADTILNLALVGEARAALDLGDKAKAITYASQVTSGSVYRVYYAEGIPTTPGLPVIPFWNAMGSPQVATSTTAQVSGGFNYAQSSLWYAVDPTFQNLKDPRVPTTPTTVRAMNAAQVYVPNKPRSFGGYVAPSTALPGGQAMTPGASIRIASYLEAQYIIAEANGGSATTLAFVNQQRAANGQAASTATTPAAVLADLRDQRRREFYLDGHRVGDLRRYLTQYQVDQFPSGPYQGSTTTSYGTATCLPIPISEINANPNAAGG